MKEKNLFSRLASGLCLLLSILLITTFFMPVYKISLPASELVEKESSVSFSNFDIIMATTYDSFEDYIGQDAEETLTKLAAYSAAKSDDQTLLFVVMAHAVLIVLSLIALIVMLLTSISTPFRSAAFEKLNVTLDRMCLNSSCTSE